ncbi:MAG: tripartite tricarboxylate transporter substrate binding protein, partial [Candidatus Rokubacteria bacterium]|nr:tripartite tricarboxylate transporter substrate binding protein [Candidatus Rokubacteria bacterium]
MSRRWFALALVVATLLMPLASLTRAQEAFPSRPITLVAPFPPGGVADLTARPVAVALERVLKTPVAVVNKVG